MLRDESREVVAFADIGGRPGRGRGTDSGGGDTEVVKRKSMPKRGLC